MSLRVSGLLERLDAEGVADECERLEEMAAAEGKEHTHALEHMIALILCGEIHEARFLYMRLSAVSKKRCESAWRVVQLLRAGDIIEMGRINELSWGEGLSCGLHNAIDEMKRRLYETTLQNISRTYEVISKRDLKRLLDTSDEALEQVCLTHNWKKKNDEFIVIAPIASSRLDKTGDCTQQLQRLTEQLVRLQT